MDDKHTEFHNSTEFHKSNEIHTTNEFHNTNEIHNTNESHNTNEIHNTNESHNTNEIHNTNESHNTNEIHNSTESHNTNEIHNTCQRRRTEMYKIQNHMMMIDNSFTATQLKDISNDNRGCLIYILSDFSKRETGVRISGMTLHEEECSVLLSARRRNESWCGCVFVDGSWQEGCDERMLLGLLREKMVDVNAGKEVFVYLRGVKVSEDGKWYSCNGDAQSVALMDEDEFLVFEQEFLISSAQVLVEESCIVEDGIKMVHLKYEENQFVVEKLPEKGCEFFWRNPDLVRFFVRVNFCDLSPEEIRGYMLNGIECQRVHYRFLFYTESQMVVFDL
eukprot:TRINITY_DN2186_c0_g1_i2.p1 TRINITY_DN2186_c0_g1~~TRINITY_DN2186_c0_g1_i2.p1  ORF type:complete len:346 (-),score=59.04 TRINITY_DN2186_c0_g1_i2:13-1014(-)